MSSATNIRPAEPIIVYGGNGRSPRPPASPNPSSPSAEKSDSDAHQGSTTELDMKEAIRLASLCKGALNLLADKMPDFNPSQPFNVEEILALPLDVVRVDESLLHLPRRKSRRMPLAAAIAALLFPSHEGSLSPLIKYDADRVKIRAWVTLQRNYDMLAATKRNGHSRFGLNGGAAPGVHAPVWASRILRQGPWDPEQFPVSFEGPKSLPMPVEIAEMGDLEPFFLHLRGGGTHERPDGCPGVDLDGGKGEHFYGTKGLEFTRGVLYEDRRMDLCKMVVGPTHIEGLMDSLRTNKFVKHFLLGNNIIGPVGAKAIAKFVDEFPDRMDTWYLAGNCIDSAGFKILVDAMVKSPAVTNIWLKRNPLGPGAVEDIFRLITQTQNLRTLDLDQTELGDIGAADLFTRLAEYVESTSKELKLEILYLNGNGISKNGAEALAKFLAAQAKLAPSTALHSIYLSSNPLGNSGAEALAHGVANAPALQRLTLQSVGLGAKGAIALCDALVGHPGIRVFDVSQGYTTVDLAQAYNYIEDPALPSITTLLSSPTCKLEYFTLGHCALTPPSLRTLSETIRRSPLLFYQATSIHPDPAAKLRPLIPSQGNVFDDITTGAALTREQTEAEKAVARRLEANVKRRYGEGMTYARFREDEKRWLVSDRRDVRKIDSVYRTRDMGLARRRVLGLVKEWGEGDATIEGVMKGVEGPFCGLRKRG